MTDVVISGNTAVRKAPAPPPTVEVQMEPPTVGPEQLPDGGEGADLRLARVSDPITLSEDGRELREEIRRQKREPDPIYEWKAGALPEAGEHESHAKQLRRASESMHSARIAALGETFAKAPGATPESGQAAAEFIVAAPATKVIPVGDNGQPIAPLRDDQPITELDSFQNLAEAKRGMQNFRDAQERERVALLQSLQAAAEQEAEAARQAEQRAQAPAPQPQPRPQPQPNPLAAQVRAVEQQLNVADRQAAHEQAQIRQWAEAVYPPEVLQNPQARAELQRSDPNAAEWLRIADNRFGQLQQHRQGLRQIDTAQKIQVAQVQQHEMAVRLQQHNAVQDAEFQRMLEAEMPHFAKGKARQELIAAATKMMQSQPDIWADYHRGGAARSPGIQMQIAKAAAYEVLQQGRPELASKRGHAPAPIAPGPYQSVRGADALDLVRDLERQMDAAAPGRRQNELGMRLLQARRAAGLT